MNGASDSSFDELVDWIVTGVSGEQSRPSGLGQRRPSAPDVPDEVCGLRVGSVFEVARAHQSLRGHWRVVKLDRGPRGTARVWAQQPQTTGYLPLTEYQIRDAIENGWLLRVHRSER